MREKLFRLTALTGLVLLSISPLTSFAEEITVDGKITIDEKQLREIVKEVIKDNPKLILDTINTHVREEKKRKQAKRLEDSFKKPITDIPVGENNPSMGPDDAVITLIEYTDFECPYCSKGAKTLKQVLKKYPDKVRVFFKNNPLDFHKKALPAAKAALAANKQGKFWEYHDLLFENSSELEEEKFVKFAQDLKLDMEKFEVDRNSPEIADQIEAEMAETKKHSLRGTPTFLANGVVIRGAQNLEYFSKVIDRILAEMSGKAENKPSE